MKIAPYLSRTLFIMVIIAAISCNKDDDDNLPQLEVWETEVAKVKSATSQYLNFGAATNDGLIDVSGYVPNMGHHYLNPGLSDGTFELEKPEIILYVMDQDSVMQMVAVEYGIVPDDPNNPGSPPEGFTGDQDEWHFNEMIGQWQLHVWTILENPDGIFASFNSEIGD